MLGITAGARKNKKAPYMMDRRHQKCNWTLSKGLTTVTERQEKGSLISGQHSQEEKTDQCVIQG